jgi:hypothetical protein
VHWCLHRRSSLPFSRSFSTLIPREQGHSAPPTAIANVKIEARPSDVDQPDATDCSTLITNVRGHSAPPATVANVKIEAGESMEYGNADGDDLMRS